MRTLLGLVTLALAASASRQAVSHEWTVVMHDYPAYEEMEGFGKPPQSSVRLSFLHTPDGPPGVHKNLFVTDQAVIKHKQRWTFPTTGNIDGFRIGIACRYTCWRPHGRHRRCAHCLRKWYVWLRISPDALYQPLVYRFSDPHSPNHHGGPAHFEAALGSTFQSFFADHQAIFVERFNVDEVERTFWEQYVDIGPKTFTEVLRWHYGLVGPAVSPEPTPIQTATLVDVRPGMRLRVENAVLQDEGNHHRNENESGALRGYVATSATYMQVSEQSTRDVQEANPFLSFDPFLGHLREVMKEPGMQGTSNVATGALDLHTPAVPARFFRLAYPPTWFFGTKIGATPKDHVVLIGSDDRADLHGVEVFRLLRADGYDWSTDNATDPLAGEGFSRSVWTFRGRSFVVPEIQVRIGGASTYVSVGTQFRQAVQRYVDWDLSSGLRAPPYLYRRHKNGVHRVRFRVDGSADAPCFNIPLLKGDEIRW